MRFAGVADGMPGCPYAGTDRGFRDDPTVPDGLDQLVARYHGVTVFDEMPKDVKDLGLDVHRRAGNRQLAARAVERAIGELVNHGLSREHESQSTPELMENQRSLNAVFKHRRSSWAIVEVDRIGVVTLRNRQRKSRKDLTMYTNRIHATTALTGIAAVLIVFAAGPVVAGHGLAMQEHPLRGDFPTAGDEAKSASAEDVAAANPQPRQRDEPGGWLRGDFPLAAESRSEQASPEPATAGSKAIVTRGLGETWSCTVQTASAQDAGGGPTQAVMRVIHLPQ